MCAGWALGDFPRGKVARCGGLTASKVLELEHGQQQRRVDLGGTEPASNTRFANRVGRPWASSSLESGHSRSADSELALMTGMAEEPMPQGNL